MDRMDDIWKDRFNSEDLPSGEWNTPDDMVWQNIANSTVRENGKRRATLWIWTLAGLLILLLGFVIISNGFGKILSDSNKDVKNNIVKQSILTSNLSPADSPKIINSTTAVSQKYVAPATNNSASNQLNLNTQQIANTSIINTQEKLNPTTATNNQVAKQTIQKDLQKVVTNSKRSTPVIENIEASPILDNSISTIRNIQGQQVSENNEISTTAPNTVQNINPQISFNTVGTKLPTTIASIEEIQLDLDNQELKEPKPGFPISLSATVGASYWKHQISKNYTELLSPADFNYTDEFGYLLNLDASIPLGNRFTLSTGLDYEQINVSSGHNSALSYDPAAEEIDQSNAYALSLATPYGLAGAEFRFDRAEEIGDNPVDLLVDFHSGHTIRNFSVPLTLEYYPLGKRRIISPILKAGFGVNYLSGISNRIKSIDTHHSAIQFDNSDTASFMAPNITKWHYDYRLGLGARIQWRRDFAIVLNYERVGGINSIFEQDAYNTRINRQHLSIGLNKVLLNLR